MSTPSRRTVSWQRDPRGGLLVVSLGFVIAAFVMLAVAVIAAPWFIRFDARMSLDIRSLGWPWLGEAARLLYTLGRLWPMALLTAFTATALYARGRRAEALLIVISVAAAALAGDGLRLVIGRSRPAIPYAAGAQVGPYGFPSVHALVSFVYFGCLGFISLIDGTRLHRSAGLVTLFALLAALIGLAPVYIGTQYLGDTIGGWLLGGAMTTLMLLLGATWGASSEGTSV